MEQGTWLETLRKKIESRRLGTRYTRHEHWIHGRTLGKASIGGTTIGLQRDLVVDDTEERRVDITEVTKEDEDRGCRSRDEGAGCAANAEH